MPSEAGLHSQAAPEALARMREVLATAAAQWFTFEGLRQTLLTGGASDPYVVSPNGGDVKIAVLRMLDPSRVLEEVERAYLALYRALSAHREVAMSSMGNVAGPGQLAHPPGALQALLAAKEDVFARWHDFQTGMQRVGATLCQIRVDGDAVGTGFLVGDQAVLTAFHCVQTLVVGDKPAANSDERLTVTFDDVKMPGTTRSANRTDVKVARAWLLAHSPPDEHEDHAVTPLDEVNPKCLDFALIKLAEPAGRLAPRFQTVPRKWLDLTELASQPFNQTQVLIAHHPGGADLRLSVGLFRDHCLHEMRVRYLAPAVVGSSGAPCFSIEWKPYALHNAGYDTVPVNQGVPLRLIWDAIDTSGALASAGPEVNLIPPVTIDGEPILGRSELAKRVEDMLAGRSSTRAINIVADEGGGKRYTGTLLRSVVRDAGHFAFLLSMERFATDTPETFADRLVEEIRPGTPTTSMPPMPDSRQRARWVSRRLSEWVRNGLAGDSSAKVPQTIWMIFEGCRTAPLTVETQDLLLALIGQDIEEEDHSLRFVFLDYPGSFSAIAPELVWQLRLELLSAAAVEPFMAHVLRSMGVEESQETIAASAAQYVEAVRTVGISDIPSLVAGLKRWRDDRKRKVAVAAGENV